jgi:hypothetical protein
MSDVELVFVWLFEERASRETVCERVAARAACGAKLKFYPARRGFWPFVALKTPRGSTMVLLAIKAKGPSLVYDSTRVKELVELDPEAMLDLVRLRYGL